MDAELSSLKHQLAIAEGDSNVMEKILNILVFSRVPQTLHRAAPAMPGYTTSVVAGQAAFASQSRDAMRDGGRETPLRHNHNLPPIYYLCP